MDEQLHLVASIFEASSIHIFSDEFGQPKFSPLAWENTLNLLKTCVFEAPKTNPTPFSYESNGSPVAEVNDMYVDHVVHDIQCVTFNGFYPRIITKLVDEEKFPYASPLREYYHVVKLHKDLKRLQLERSFSNEGYLAYKLWVNYGYGMLPKYNVDNTLVSGYARTIFDSLKASSYRWYLVNTEEIWLRIQDSNTIADFGIPYEILDVPHAVFFSKKKYIASVIDGGTRETRFVGFKMEKWDSNGNYLGKNSGIR